MKPMLIGMANPLSRRAEDALVPWPAGCTGHRLWSMYQMAGGGDADEYLAAFTRRNLVASSEWDARIARAAASEILATSHPGMTYVVLGAETWAAFKFRVARPEPCKHVPGWDTRWFYVPHPSGRNLWYNNEENWKMVGSLLVRLSREAPIACVD